MSVGDVDLLRAIQHYTARAAIGSSSMRGAGSKGVVAAARTYLGNMPLRPFGTSKASIFRSELDNATEELRSLLPKKAQRWGLARKALNIFLRNCLYTSYLRDNYKLSLAEYYFEVPLDSITSKRLRESAAELPRWDSVRRLTPDVSVRYQDAAMKIAAVQYKGTARVHLDAVWWGERAES
jgi:hypothetical protein